MAPNGKSRFRDRGLLATLWLRGNSSVREASRVSSSVARTGPRRLPSNRVTELQAPYIFSLVPLPSRPLFVGYLHVYMYVYIYI